MPQCEMCGADKPSLTTTKVEGAELELCDSCTDFGTEVRTDSSSSGSSTKYSTSSSSSSSTSGGSSSSSGGSSSSSARRRKDMFDDMDTLAQDYHDRIRSARESTGMSQEDLAKKLNEKASLIRKLERGEVLPSDEVQSKLERELSISLTEESSSDESEWESEAASEGYTLGDVVKRKD
jgi:putative transcription factor